jgi:hypothetical protein
MKYCFLIVIFFFGLVNLCAQGRYSGNVIDAWDKKYLEGVVVTNGKGEEAKTNARGYFSISSLMGDTLVFSFPGFLEKKWVANSEYFLFIELQDRARLLPTFQVKAEPYSFRFKDGKLTLVEEPSLEETPLSQQVGIGVDSTSPNPGFTIYGPISYFTKRNRQLRAYEKRMEWEKRRQGYLEVIDSDSLRTSLMDTYQLDRREWDDLILRFNAFHASHEFLDWPKARVLEALLIFFRLEAVSED